MKANHTIRIKTRQFVFSQSKNCDGISSRQSYSASNSAVYINSWSKQGVQRRSNSKVMFHCFKIREVLQPLLHILLGFIVIFDARTTNMYYIYIKYVGVIICMTLLFYKYNRPIHTQLQNDPNCSEKKTTTKKSYESQQVSYLNSSDLLILKSPFSF